MVRAAARNPTAFTSRRIGNFIASARVSRDVSSAQRNLTSERLRPALISTSGLIWSRLRLAFVGISVTLAVTACGSLAVGPTTADVPLVQQLAGEVSDARAMEHLQALQKIADENGGNRAAGTSGYDASVNYVVDVLRDAGFKASTPTFEASDGDGEGSGPQRNVIAQTRSGDPGQVVMIGAHLDSVEDGPGIVDNGSGVATLLEIATQLGADPSVKNTVRFGFFGDEESGAVGSTGYLEGISADDRKKIKLYLNVDMVASPNGGYLVQGGSLVVGCGDSVKATT